MKLIEIEGGLLALMRFNFAALKIGCYFPASSFSVCLSVSFEKTHPRASHYSHSDTLAFALSKAFVDVLALELLLEALGAHTDEAEEQEDEEDATDDARDNAVRVLLVFGIPQGLLLSRNDAVKLIVQLVEV